MANSCLSSRIKHPSDQRSSPLLCSKQRYEGNKSAKNTQLHFSDQSDDDDIILLNPSDIVYDEVKTILDSLINRISDQEYSPSQIHNRSAKRLLDVKDEDQSSLNRKKVRSDVNQSEHSTSKSLFVSETIDNPKDLQPVAQFLYHLGLDLCLEQNSNEFNGLSEEHQQTLTDFNRIFHSSKIYSCKYCSFKTDTIHALDHHRRMPHTVDDHKYRYIKYRCTLCPFQTIRLSLLRQHSQQQHQFTLVKEPEPRRYPCSFCLYETNDKPSFIRHLARCEIEQERARAANNLLAPPDEYQLNRRFATPYSRTSLKPLPTKKPLSQTKTSSTKAPVPNKNISLIEPIVIGSDNDSFSTSSDEEFFVSSDKDSSADSDTERNSLFTPQSNAFQQKKTTKPDGKTTKSTTTYSTPNPLPSTSLTPATTNSLPYLSKLLTLNGASVPSYSTPISSSRPSLSTLQLKPPSNNDKYQICNICGCYVYKDDFIKHINEKHQHLSRATVPIVAPSLVILNNATNNANIPIAPKPPNLTVTKTTPESPRALFLMSTSNMNLPSINLNMIKCPWCPTTFEHIDVMTGHLMRYHRMTLAAAKVVVAEEMKSQGASSSQLSLMFKEEIEQIQRDFSDKTFWKCAQPKVYLHQVTNILCFMCDNRVDDVEQHFLYTHQIELLRLKTIKQCCLCGTHCDKDGPTLIEHQLRSHNGICFSSVLKQFIRFEPAPALLSATKISPRSILPSTSSQKKTLVTYTEEKFGCRKCESSSRLFTFEELVDHLQTNHHLNVKLHRRCILCQETFPKGKEYNQHCLEHLNEEDPSIVLRRHYDKSAKRTASRRT